MIKRQLAVWMCVGVMIMAAGCTKVTVAESDTAETISGEAGQENVPEDAESRNLSSGEQAEDTESRNLPSEEQAEDTESRNLSSEEQTEDADNQDTLAGEQVDNTDNQDALAGDQAEDTASDELEGDVLSVDYNNKMVTVSEIFTETNDDGSSVAVSFLGGGGEDAGSITVYFMDDISYTLQIIKDGGADVTTKEAAFSDIQEGDILNLTGKRAFSEKSGDEFLASEVTISRVILE